MTTRALTTMLVWHTVTREEEDEEDDDEDGEKEEKRKTQDRCIRRNVGARICSVVWLWVCARESSSVEASSCQSSKEPPPLLLLLLLVLCCWDVVSSSKERAAKVYRDGERKRVERPGYYSGCTDNEDSPTSSLVCCLLVRPVTTR